MESRKKCPKCNKGVLDERTRRGAFVRTFLFWLPIKRYRCSVCYQKSYVWGSVYKQPEELSS
ncbi:hypothetical protein [Mucilaginibacter koreensis]